VFMAELGSGAPDVSGGRAPGNIWLLRGLVRQLRCGDHWPLRTISHLHKPHSWERLGRLDHQYRSDQRRSHAVAPLRSHRKGTVAGPLMTAFHPTLPSGKSVVRKPMNRRPPTGRPTDLSVSGPL